MLFALCVYMECFHLFNKVTCVVSVQRATDETQGTNGSGVISAINGTTTNV